MNASANTPVGGKTEKRTPTPQSADTGMTASVDLTTPVGDVALASAPVGDIAPASHSEAVPEGEQERPDQDQSTPILSELLSELRLFRSDMKAMRKDMSVFRNEILSIRTDITSCRGDLALTNTRVDKVEECVAEIKSLINKKDDIIKGLRADNVKLANISKDQEARLVTLEREHQQQQQWTRLQNIEITGVPENEGESTVSIVQKVARITGVELSADDVEFAHRVQPLRAKAGQSRALVVRIRQRATKDKLIAAARKYRDGLHTSALGVKGEPARIYINEHLTVANKKLLHETRKKATEKGYTFTWTKNCRIFVRKNIQSPHILIASVTDLKKLI